MQTAGKQNNIQSRLLTQSMKMIIFLYENFALLLQPIILQNTLCLGGMFYGVPSYIFQDVVKHFQPIH